jgi:rhamnose utilization protein RhaD (predicted bifunctional aldolase and dehydrogenase)
MNFSLELDPDFRAFSQKLGANPMRIQGPGGNTSLKNDEMMWIKASGTELANALETNVFVAVDLAEARRQAGGAGDGTCKDAVLDPDAKLRPSIETTFHAALEWAVVAHTHSVHALAHITSDEGTEAALEKLSGLPVAVVPYAKPGVPLTTKILEAINSETQVVLLQNHGIICCGNSVSEVDALMEDVETRLNVCASKNEEAVATEVAPEGYEWVPKASVLATGDRLFERASRGTYYPDHIVFLGPALPLGDHDLEGRPAVLVKGQGVAMRTDATPAQRAMLDCLVDVLCRVPPQWKLKNLSPDQEAELLNWDAEKYRQALAQRGLA